MTYGEKIAHLRRTKGMTQEELGKILNVTYQAVSKWERGESLPDFPTMSLIAKYFEVPLNYFEDDGENKQAADGESACAATVAANNTVNNYAGVCTVCGKMLTEDEVFSSSPKIICKACAERLKKDAENKRKNEEAAARFQKEQQARAQLGGGFDVKLIISVILAIAGYAAFTALCFVYKTDSYMYAAMLLVVPLAAFACTQAVFDLINELRDKDDDSDGYNLKLSLIVAGIFSAVNVILNLVLYLSFGKEFYFLILMAAGAILSFAFVSQIMWGSVLKEIFTCGGFTFKLPGFIFSLTPESIIWMIVTKLFLGILSVIIFIVTTILFAVIAILGSFVTFIPCLLSKIRRDNKARASLR